MLDVVGAAMHRSFKSLAVDTAQSPRHCDQRKFRHELIRSMQRGQTAGFGPHRPLAMNSNQGLAYVLATKKRLRACAAASADCDFVLVAAAY
jgi:hypothetical protein